MKPKSTLLSFLLAAGSSLLAVSSASAASGTWLGNGLDWNNSAAWSGGTIADGSGSTANFTGVDLTSDVSMALGANRTIDDIIFTDAGISSHNLTLTGNTLTLAGTPTINVTQTDRNLTISSLLAGTAGFSKTGLGTLTLSGSNTITGATSISGGGTLVLDYTTNDNRKLPNNSTLSLAAGTIVLKGGTATENFTSTTFNTGTNGTFFVRDGGTAKMNLNAFTVGNGSTVSFSHDSMATTDRLNVAGIMGAWFTVGNRWATNGGVGGAGTTGAAASADGDIVGYTGGTTFTPAAATNFDVNYDLAGSATLTGSRTVNTLRIESTANDQVLTLGANNLQTSNFTGTNALAGTSGGLLYAGGANGNYTITGTTGRLQIENQNGQGQLINVYSGTLTVDAIVGSGSSPLVKSGEGTLVLKKDNAYGSLRVYQGVVRLDHNNALDTTSTVQNGAAIELSNGISVGAFASTITGTGISNGGALRSVATTTSSFAGAITIGTGGARINSDSTGTLTLTGGIVTAGNNITFGGAGNTTVSTAAISGAGGLVKDGAGTTTLSFANSYTGSTTVSAGTLAITGTGSINTSSGISVAAGGTFRYNSSTALTKAPTLAGAGTSNRAVLGGTGPINVGVTLDNTGDVLSPGNSPGTQSYTVGQTWASFSYDWEVNDFTGTTAGMDFDQITGTDFNLTGGSGSYILNVLGLTELDAPGLTPNFSEINRTWTILTSSGTSTFNAANWSINTTGFTDPDTGTWALTQSGNNLVLSYTVVPEPRAALLGGLGMIMLLRRRR